MGKYQRQGQLPGSSPETEKGHELKIYAANSHVHHMPHVRIQWGGGGITRI